VIIGGQFEAVNGVARANLARLLSNGTVDASFTVGVTIGGPVWAVATQPDGRILVGGNFSGLPGGAERCCLVRLESDGSLDTSFPLSVRAGIVHSILVQPDGRILVGGIFSLVGSVTTILFVRLNSDGSLDSSFAPNITLDTPMGLVPPSRIALQTDGQIILSGRFAAVGGVARNRLARVHADGSVDAAFDPNPDFFIHAIAVRPDGRIVVGGQFTNIAGGARNYLAQLQVDGTLDSAFNPSPNSWVFSLMLQPDSRIVVGGRFTAVGGIGTYLVFRLNLDGSPDATFGPFPFALNQDVEALALQPDGKILVGGVFGPFPPNTNRCVTRMNSQILPLFADDPVFSGLTVIRAVHINELRSRIDAVRGGYSLGPWAYSESISVGTPIKASHIIELRAALAEAYVTAGKPQPTYSTSPGVGVPIRALDIAELRWAVQAIE
jgi:uncharacterized delta-60 repeat protein